MSYKNLITYQQTEEIYDLTVRFCQEFIPNKYRQKEQMEQAARSGKQNIVEGASQGTSLKGYIKLLGIARGSLEELLEDYRDFARQRGLEIWKRGDLRIEKVKRVKKEERVNLLFPSSPSRPSLPSNPSLILNYLIDLIIRTNYLLDRQKSSLEQKFIQEGGWTEKMFKKRINYRNKGQFG